MPSNLKNYTGVDDKAHLSDGRGKSGKGAAKPLGVYGGVDPMSATHGSGKAGAAKPGGRKMRSKG